MQKQRYREISWPAVAALALVAFAVTLGSLAAGQSENKAPSAEKAQTKVVLLGTGTPRPYPDRSGPATAIVAGARAYPAGFGAGGGGRAAAAAGKGTAGMGSTELKNSFFIPLPFVPTPGY